MSGTGTASAEFRSIAITIIVIVVSTIAIRGSNNMIQTTVPLLAHYNFSFSKFEVGMLSAVFGIATFVTTTLLNSRLEVRARKTVFMMAAFAYPVIILAIFFTTPLMLWALTAASGAITGLLMPNMITAAGLFTDRKIRERSIAMYTTALSISLIFGPAIETYILGIFPLKYAFLFFVSFGVVAAAFSPFIKFPDQEEKTKRPKFTMQRGFKTAVLLNLSYNIPFILITVFAGIYAKTDLGVSYSGVTLFYTVFFTTSFIARLTLTVRRPSENLSFLVALSLILTVAGVALMSFSAGFLMFGVAMALLGVPHGTSFPVSLVYVSRSYSPDLRSTANSFFFSIVTIVLVSGPILGGYSTQQIGFRTTFLLLVPIVSVLAVITMLSLKAGKEHRL